MDERIKLTDVQGNDILVWNEIEKKFINLPSSYQTLGLEKQELKLQRLSPNHSLIKKIGGDTLHQKGIVGGNNVEIIDNGNDLVINAVFDGNADTISGYTHNDFVKLSQLNDSIDVNYIFQNADIYTKAVAHDVFMETNASNIPDKDNTYDLGSNGRRYADIFAVTFHGTATNAVRANTLNRNGARDGNALIWSEENNRWEPKNINVSTIEEIDGFSINNPSTGDVLTYKESTGEWVNIDPSDIEISLPEYLFKSANNTGVPILGELVGNIVNFKTIIGSPEIDVTIDDVDDSVIQISLSNDFMESLDVTTDGINEGNENLYFTEDRVVATVQNKITGQDFSFWNIETDGIVKYENGQLVSTTIPDPTLNISELLDVDVTGITNGQTITWDGTKFTPYNIPENTDLLSEVDTYQSQDMYLKWDGNDYILALPEIGTTLDDIDTSTATDGYVLTWNGSRYVLRELGEGGTPVASDMLSEVNTTGAVDGHVLTWNGADYELRESTSPSSIDDLDDVRIYQAVNGQVLTYRDGTLELEDIIFPTSYSIADVEEFGTLQNDQYLIMRNGSIVSETITIPESKDNIVDLNDVNIDMTVNGGLLTIENGVITETIIDIPTNEDFSLSGLSDVTLTGNGFVAYENGQLTTKTIPTQSFRIIDATDSDFTTAQNGQVVTYNNGLFELTNVDTGVSNIESLNDVSVTSKNVGDVLTWDGTNYTLTTIDTGTTIESLSDINDVTITNPVDGQVLTYSAGSFVLTTIDTGTTIESLSDINDVSIGTKNVGDVLSWDGTNYTLTTPSQSVSSFVDLDDVNITSLVDGKMIQVVSGQLALVDAPTSTANDNLYTMNDVNIDVLENGHYLMWDGSAFVLNAIPTTSGVTNLSELSDVNTSGVTTGQVLTYNGTGFVFDSVASTSDTLGDVDTTSASDGYYVAFNGTGYELRALPAGSTDTLSEVDTSTAQSGDVLVWDGSKYVVQNINTIYDLDTSGVDTGYYLTYNGTDFVFQELPTLTDALSQVDTTTASNGDVLTWNGTGYVLSTPEDNDTLGSVDTTSASDGHYVAFNGTGYELRALPAGSTDTLSEVDTSTAQSGDVLVWDGSKYVVQDINTLDDVDTSTATNGQVLTYNGSDFVLESVSDKLSQIATTSASDGDYVAFNTTTSDYELRSLPQNTDTLGDVDTSTASSGDSLVWDGTGYTLSSVATPSMALNDLTDVNITSPQADQVLSWNGTEFTLATVSSTGGASSVSELSDVDETVTPADGNVLTYNGTKSQYEPLPLPVGGSGGTKYEILRVQYATNNDYESASPVTDNIRVTNMLSAGAAVFEVEFTGYTFPPISVGYWGYIYSQNFYQFINVTESIMEMKIDGGGTSGAPVLFDGNPKTYTLTMSASVSESQSSPSVSFPPEPTHAYIVFVMGE